MAKQAVIQTRKRASPRAKQIDMENRKEMIALEAYLRAEQRGFKDGDPLEDWLDAEAYVDNMLR